MSPRMSRIQATGQCGGEGNTPEYRAVHPHGQLPALKTDDEVMIESGAIVQWLAGDPSPYNAPGKDFWVSLRLAMEPQGSSRPCPLTGMLVAIIRATLSVPWPAIIVLVAVVTSPVTSVAVSVLRLISAYRVLRPLVLSLGGRGTGRSWMLARRDLIARCGRLAWVSLTRCRILLLYRSETALIDSFTS